jgi:hypothetical protein
MTSCQSFESITCTFSPPASGSYIQDALGSFVPERIAGHGILPFFFDYFEILNA